MKRLLSPPLASIALPTHENFEYKEQSKATRSTIQTFIEEYDYSEKGKQIKNYFKY